MSNLMLDGLKELFIEAIKFDGDNAKSLVNRWNKEIQRVSVRIDNYAQEKAYSMNVSYGYAGEWFPVKDKRPVGTANRVLCICKRSPTVYMGHYDEKKGWINLETERKFSSEVTHWQYLPPLPMVI